MAHVLAREPGIAHSPGGPPAPQSAGAGQDARSSRAPYLRIALVGNPNAGKSSVFNMLTGLRAKVGNLPGVTVDRKEGLLPLTGPGGGPVTCLDLPGVYSLSPRSPDEQIVSRILLDPANALYPEAILYVADAANLKRNLFLFTQAAQLGLPMVVALTMTDVATTMGINIDDRALSDVLGVPVVVVNPRTGEGRQALLGALIAPARPPGPPPAEGLITNEYARFILEGAATALDSEGRAAFRARQARDTVARYALLDQVLTGVERRTGRPGATLTARLDQVLLHPVWGYGVFLLILALIFQAVFWLAAFPMEAIDALMTWGAKASAALLGEGTLAARIVSEGLVPGIGGVVVFVPQILILFTLIALLEDTGYMARVVFISDRIMRRFGLSGRSVVPMFSGFACAVPAIMAARTIESRRDRLITILVTPFISCSARLPVFTLLAALAVPPTLVWGFLSLPGLVLFALYLTGVLVALASGWVLKQLVRLPPGARSVFMLELPYFKAPRWQAVLMEALSKVREFVVEAGRIIIVIALLLWFMASYGPPGKMEAAEARVLATTEAPATTTALDDQDQDLRLAEARLEASWAGHLGQGIEPILGPMGLDWRIGISLIASLAAREVFVGTMATIHSVGADDEAGLLERMRQARDTRTGRPLYRPSVAFSLMVFYLLAMQCMSTFAIVRRETASWRWAIGQLVGMTVLAWLASVAVYQLIERVWPG